MKTSASEQVQEWLTALTPEMKRRVRDALRRLENGKGDIKPLHGELAGFSRLRVGGLRIVFSRLKGQIIRLEFADTRDVVYENFLRIVESREP